jgi:hypothetical protein
MVYNITESFQKAGEDLRILPRVTEDRLRNGLNGSRRFRILLDHLLPRQELAIEHNEPTGDGKDFVEFCKLLINGHMGAECYDPHDQ